VSIPATGRGSATEVFVESLRLGLTSFGGPIAHLGYQRRAFVERLGWIDEATFAALVALCQTLPGPASSQLSIAVGRIRAGWSGALAAFVGFTLPSALLMALVAVLLGATGVADAGPVSGAIAGLKAAAVGVVAQAVVSMSRRLAPDRSRVLLAAAAAALVLGWPAATTQVVTIALGAVVGWLAWGRRGDWGDGDPAADRGADGHRPASSALEGRVGGRRTTVVMSGLFAAMLGAAFVAPALGAPSALEFVAALVRAGALVFGGGHVVLPLLDAGVVAPGWVSPDAFVAGYGFAQAVPGPLFSFAAFLGAISAAGPGGFAGATVATIAIFLPGALLVLAALPVLGATRDRPWVTGALRGVSSAVVGILAAALVTPVGTAGVTSAATALVAAAATVALLTERVPPLAVVAGAAATLAALSAVGVH